MSIQDLEALGKLNSSICQLDGHYEVGMLWKHENPWLSNNRLTAAARLRSPRRRVSADEQFYCKYRNFVDDLLTKGYARKLTEDEAAARSPGSDVISATPRRPPPTQTGKNTCGI